MSHGRYYLKARFRRRSASVKQQQRFQRFRAQTLFGSGAILPANREKRRLTAEIGLFVGIIAAVVESVAFRRERNTATVVARELSRSLARRVRYGHTQTLAAWR